MKKKEAEQIINAEVRPTETENAETDQNQETAPEVEVKESKVKAFAKKALEKGKKAIPAALTGIAGIGIGCLIMGKLGMKVDDIASPETIEELIPDSVKESVSEVAETAVEAAVDQISD